MNTIQRFVIDLSVLSVVILSSAARAENWPNWRGPDSRGVAAGPSYPVRWSNEENVAWKFQLPGIGGSTPAVWGDHIFVTCPSEGKNLLLCLDREGNLRWQSELGQDSGAKHKRKGSGSNPSPTTDGEHVFCYFRSGDLAALDFAGNVMWKKNLQQEFAEDTLWWDLGTSPVLTSDALVVACIQTGPSYLAAFQKATGELLWKRDRQLEAPDESNQTYSTPIVYHAAGDQRLAVLGADHVTGHDASSGEEIWRVGGLNPTGQRFFRSIASPVISGQIIAAPYARGATLTAIRVDGRGDVTSSHVAWTREDFSSDVPTAVAKDGKFFVLTDKGHVVALEAESGKVLWQGSAPRNRHAYSASPILAGGKLYITREDGVTFVLASDRFEILAENSLDDEQVLATPVFVDGRVLIRTSERLYCLGK